MSDKPAQDNRVLSYQRAISIELLRNCGGFAVKAPKGQKNPSKGWDPKTNNRHQSDELINELAVSDDNLGVHLHSNLVDVDIDSDAPYLMAALDRLLPQCSHIWGRPSRPKTHRIYSLKSLESFDPADYPILNTIKKIDEAKVELRGGPQTRGEYSMLPGSIHPEGEPYEWHNISDARSSVSVTTPEVLLRAVRLGGAIAILAPLFMEGVRNDLVMALSGFLHKAYTIGKSLIDEENAQNVFCMDRDDSLLFLKVLMEVAEDDPSDKVARVKTFIRTWDKAERDVPVTGGTTIAKIAGDDSVLRKLYILLTDSQDIAAIEEFTTRFSIWQGPGVVVDMDAAGAGAVRPFMSRQSFINSYGHRFVSVGGKKRLLADLLFHMPSTLRIAGITFEPGQDPLVNTREGIKVNQWCGCTIAPWEGAVSDDDIYKFLDYVKNVICDGDEEKYDWVIAWIADIFQHPGDKCGTALVLVGQQGAGKSFLGHQIINKIIGAQHAATTNNVESITKDFNVAFDNKIFTQCDEATNNRQRGIANKLKALITDPERRVEPKGIDSYFKPNHSRFCFTSNDTEDAMNIRDGMEDRRYTVIKVPPYKCGAVKQKEYWIPFLEWLTTENLSKIHRWLLDLKYDRGLIRSPLMTAAKTEMVQRSWDPFDAWLAAMVSREHPIAEECHDNWYDATKEGMNKHIDRDGWPDYVSMTALVKDYTRHVRLNNLKNADMLNEYQIINSFIVRGMSLNDVIRITVNSYDDRKNSKIIKRVRLYRMPDLGMLLAYINKKFGVNMMSVISMGEETRIDNDYSSEDF